MCNVAFEQYHTYILCQFLDLRDFIARIVKLIVTHKRGSVGGGLKLSIDALGL